MCNFFHEGAEFFSIKTKVFCLKIRVDFLYKRKRRVDNQRPQMVFCRVWGGVSCFRINRSLSFVNLDSLQKNEIEELSADKKGFFLGPRETKEEFVLRIDKIKKTVLEETEELIPASHWTWARLHLKELFDFEPDCLPAFYSDRSMLPWQGAASWFEEDRITAVQLRNALKKGIYLWVYSRDEILAHEAVHAARSALGSDRFEEFFAYMTSKNRWRRVIGPIIRRPWEVWPFLIFSWAGPFFPLAFLGAALWAAIGFWRLALGHLTLKKAGEKLGEKIKDARKIRSILVRLTDREIEMLAKGCNLGDEIHDAKNRLEKC